jgi:hypothetical protein
MPKTVKAVKKVAAKKSPKMIVKGKKATVHKAAPKVVKRVKVSKDSYKSKHAGQGIMKPKKNHIFFASESVGEGHPDKFCD